MKTSIHAALVVASVGCGSSQTPPKEQPRVLSKDPTTIRESADAPPTSFALMVLDQGRFEVVICCVDGACVANDCPGDIEIDRVAFQRGDARTVERGALEACEAEPSLQRRTFSGDTRGARTVSAIWPSEPRSTFEAVDTRRKLVKELPDADREALASDPQLSGDLYGTVFPYTIDLDGDGEVEDLLAVDHHHGGLFLRSPPERGARLERVAPMNEVSIYGAIDLDGDGLREVLLFDHSTEPTMLVVYDVFRREERLRTWWTCHAPPFIDREDPAPD